MAIIAVTGSKGGSGKTIYSILLSTALSQLFKKRVLLIDTDPISPISSMLNVESETSFRTLDLYTRNLMAGDNFALRWLLNDQIAFIPNIQRETYHYGELHRPAENLCRDIKKIHQKLRENILCIMDEFKLNYAVLDVNGKSSKLAHLQLMASDYAVLPSNKSRLDIITLEKHLQEISTIKQVKGSNLIDSSPFYWGEKLSSKTQIPKSIFRTSIKFSPLMHEGSFSEALNAFSEDRLRNDMNDLVKEIIDWAKPKVFIDQPKLNSIINEIKASFAAENFNELTVLLGKNTELLAKASLSQAGIRFDRKMTLGKLIMLLREKNAVSETVLRCYEHILSLRNTSTHHNGIRIKKLDFEIAILMFQRISEPLRSSLSY